MPGLEIEEFYDGQKTKDWGENWSRQWIEHDITLDEKSAIEDFLQIYRDLNQYLKGFNGQFLQEKPPCHASCWLKYRGWI